MKIRETKKLSSIYPREENFSGDLANHVIHLGVGNFTDVEVESRVGTRRADIVATGDDGVLVVENQYGKAANIVFPAIEKGRKDNEHWPEVREKLVGLGEDVYNRLMASDV